MVWDKQRAGLWGRSWGFIFHSRRRYGIKQGSDARPRLLRGAGLVDAWKPGRRWQNRVGRVQLAWSPGVRGGQDSKGSGSEKGCPFFFLGCPVVLFPWRHFQRDHLRQELASDRPWTKSSCRWFLQIKFYLNIATPIDLPIIYCCFHATGSRVG